MGPFRVGATIKSWRRGSARQAYEPESLSRDSVYVIQGNGAVKIGVTSDLENRLATLQTGSPHPLSLAYHTRVNGDAYAVESEAHSILDRYRVSGEWFAVTPDIAVAAINGAAYRLGGFDSQPPQEDRSRLRTVAWTTAIFFPFWLLAYSPIGAVSPFYALFFFVILIVRSANRPDRRSFILKGMGGGICGALIASLPAYLLYQMIMKA